MEQWERGEIDGNGRGILRTRKEDAGDVAAGRVGARQTGRVRCFPPWMQQLLELETEKKASAGVESSLRSAWERRSRV